MKKRKKKIYKDYVETIPPLDPDTETLLFTRIRRKRVAPLTEKQAIHFNTMPRLTRRLICKWNDVCPFCKRFDNDNVNGDNAICRLTSRIFALEHFSTCTRPRYFSCVHFNRKNMVCLYKRLLPEEALNIQTLELTLRQDIEGLVY